MYPTLRQLYSYDPSTLRPLIDIVKFHLHPKYRTYNDDFVDELIDRCGDFGVIYNTPQAFRKAVIAWVGVNKGVWIELAKTTTLEYDPLSNYDRTETHMEERESTDSGNNSVSGNSTSSGNNSGSGKVEVDNGSTVTDVEKRDSVEKVSAYNSEDFVNSGGQSFDGSKSSITESNSTTEQSSNDEYSGQSMSESNGNFNSSHKDKFSRSVRAFGNIGVTTSQEMLEAERRVAKFNIYNLIINQFEERFCILVY